MRVLATSAVLLAGCTFGTSVDPTSMPGEAGTTSDGNSVDAQPLDGCTTFSTALDTCAIGTYGAGLSINGNRRYDTVLHILSDESGANPTTPMFREITIGGNPITLLVVEGFTIQSAARLRVSGARAFGVISSGTISIVGTLDATDGAAGARSRTACGDDVLEAAGENGETNDAGGGNSGGSGGGGGAFRGAGGKGGTGDNNGQQLEGGDGGESFALAATVAGGCPGGRGGNQQGGGEGGAGGLGGGGVLLVSAMTLSIPGIVNAGGGGGKGGAAIDAGGGGGGAGGMIALEASSITINGIVVANGGGGGGGAGGTAGGDGTAGLIAITGAPGGLAAGTGGAGGLGGASSQNGGVQPANANGGAGGGGGGVGYVTMNGIASITGIVSPPMTAWPF